MKTNWNNTKKVLTVILATLFFLATPFTQVAFSGGGGIEDGVPKKLNLNVLLMYDADQTNIDEWEQAFNEASRLLYNSTEGQMQFGTVNVFKNCPAAKKVADIWIMEDATGRANAGGYAVLGKPGKHITIHQEDKRNTPSERGHLTIAHELGHHVFELGDEYRNIRLIFGVPIIFLTSDDGVCTLNAADPASMMQAGISVNNHRTEWCTPIEHDWNTKHNNRVINNKKNYQEVRHGESCWETIARVARDRYGIDLTIPTSQPSTNLPPGHQDINWNVIECLSRVVLCIDRSGSMIGEKIALAKLGAKIFVDLVHQGDELGVTSFAGSPSVNFPLQEVVGESTKTDAQNAIDAISAGGSTTIGGGLRTSLEQITGRGSKSASEIMVLLSNGQHNTGESPSNVIPDLQARGIRVFTIGLGAGANVNLLKSIASQTGGEFFFASSAADLPRIFTSISAEVRGGGLLKKVSDLIRTGGRVLKTIFVDKFLNEVTFALNWGGSDLDLTLLRPDGTPVDPAVAAVDPNIEYVERNNNEFYRIKSPMTGEWQLIIDAVDVLDQELFTAQVIGETGEVNFMAYTDKDQYIFPEKVLIQAEVVAGYQVASAEVTGTVDRPDGSSVNITLLDDGSLEHGDQFADDGTYSNLFFDYTEDGTYTFNLVVDNKEGIEAPSLFLGELPPPGWSPSDIDPFTRETQISVIVSNIPAALPDMTMTKWVTPSTVAPGGTVNYSINLTNTGSTDAIGVVITDTLPPGFSYQSGSTSGATTSNPSINGQILTWSGPFTVAANGGTLALVFKATAASLTDTLEIFYNNVFATSTNAPIPSTGDTAPVTVAAAPPPPRPVGGIIVPVNKFELLAPWIGLASLMIIGAAVAIFKMRKV